MGRFSNKFSLLSACIAAACLFAGIGVLSIQSESDTYQVRPVNWRTQRIAKTVSARESLNRKGTRELVPSLRKLSNQVQPVEEATVNNHKRVLVERQGKKLGWITPRSLKPVKEYMLPYHYTSQFWPSKVKDACEIASLKTAMSTQHKGMRTDLDKMVSRIPLSKDPNTGYTGDPHRYGSHASISAKAMTKIAHQYGAHAENITGASEPRFIREVTHGNAVLIECPFMMKKPTSDHDLVIMGYKPGWFYAVDPFTHTPLSRKSTWVSADRMMRLFNKPFRTQQALVIKHAE